MIINTKQVEIKIVFLIIFLCHTLFAVGQTNYYVNESTGNDSNPGTRNQPFRTINHASSITQPGDTVNAMPGIYVFDSTDSAFDNIVIARSGTEDNYITYRGISDANGNKPLIVSASNAAFTIFNRSYIIIDNFEVTTVEEDINNVIGALGLEQWRERVGFNILNNSHHIIVRNCYVHDFRGNGFQCGGSDVVLIEDNLVEHNAFHSDNGNSGISMFQMTTLNVPSFSEYPDHRLIIKNNTSRYNVNLRGFVGFNNRLTDGNGIIIDDLRHAQGDNIPYRGRTLVIGNITYGNGGMGINIFSSDQVDVYNNTMYDNAQTTRIANPAYEVAVEDAQLQIGDANDINILNNIMINSGPGRTLNRFNLGNTITFNRNIHWNSTGSINDNIDSQDFIVDPLLLNIVGLNQQQTNNFATMTNPFDENSVSAIVREPTIQNAFFIQNVSLTTESAAIDSGENHGLIPFEDAGLDIGALEFNTTTLSVDEFTNLNKNINLYPNPAKEFVMIDFNEFKTTQDLVLVEVIDLSSRKIYSEMLSTTTDPKIKTSSWQSGVYLLYFITDNSSIITKKLIIN